VACEWTQCSQGIPRAGDSSALLSSSLRTRQCPPGNFPDERAPRFEAAVLCFVLMGNHFHLVPHTHWGKSAALDGIRCWFATRFILIVAIVRSGHLF
jgi:hypothetical protein